MRKLTTAAAFAVIAILALAIAGPAAAKDRNHDKIPDKWEKKYNLSLKTNQARKDQDKDGARNKAEFRAKTNPRSADTDEDGVEDGDENAGTIESFDATTGVLVIDLFGGDTVTGVVDADTEVKCGCHGDTGDSDDGDTGDTDDDTSARHDPGDGDGDHSGPGGPGDEDHSGPGHGGSDCSVDDLIAGATVHEAELKTTADGLVYTQVELVKDDPADDDGDDTDDDDGTPDQGPGDN
jgi:hypothetical protein